MQLYWLIWLTKYDVCTSINNYNFFPHSHQSCQQCHTKEIRLTSMNTPKQIGNQSAPSILTNSSSSPTFDRLVDKKLDEIRFLSEAEKLLYKSVWLYIWTSYSSIMSLENVIYRYFVANVFIYRWWRPMYC